MPLHNHYFMLQWDFSCVDTFGDVEDIRRSLHGQTGKNDNLHPAFSYNYYLESCLPIFSPLPIVIF